MKKLKIIENNFKMRNSKLKIIENEIQKVFQTGNIYEWNNSMKKIQL